MAGYPNYGDELIARTWLRFLAETKPEAQVWLDCRHPGAASVLFRGDHPNLTTTDTLYRVLELADQEWEPRSIAEIVTHKGSPLFDLQIAEMNRATTLHLLGGGFLNSRWPKNLGLLEGMRASAAVSGARLIATGQGLIPDAGASFEGFAHVGVRDDESAELAATTTGLDDAFLGLAQLGAPLGDVNEVVVCVQSDAIGDGSFEAFLDTVESALHDAALAHARITTRFHHHLVAASRGARGFALVDPGQYYTTKHESLIELGSGWLAARPGHNVPSVADTRGQSGFDKAYARKRAEAESLYGS